MHKPLLQKYSDAYPNEKHLWSYKFIYWNLFVYYGIQGLDEMLELYSVKAKRSKGALALLFELNYFIGIGLAIYIGAFVMSGNY